MLYIQTQLPQKPNFAMFFDRGVQKPCTPEELEDETKHLWAKSDLKGTGTFYFTFNNDLIYLKFYDTERQYLHTSQDFVFDVQNTKPGKAMVFDCCIFGIEIEGEALILIMTDDWSSGYVLNDIEARIALQKVAFEESPLSKIRTGTKGDFSLESEDGNKLMVHKTVLIPLWPLFKTTLERDKQVRTTKTFKVNCSDSTLEILVRSFYGQELRLWDLEAHSIIELINVARDYELPGLLQRATECLHRDHITEGGKAIELWRKSRETKSYKLRKYAVSLINERKSHMPFCKQWIRQFTQEESQDFIMDMCRASRDDKKRRRDR